MISETSPPDIFLLMFYTLWLWVAGVIFIVLLFRKSKDDFRITFNIFTIAYLVRVLAIVLNEQLGLFESKQAGEFSLELFRKFTLGDGFDWGDNFAIQAAVNIPGIYIVGLNSLVVLVTNAFIGAIAFVPAYCFLKRVSGREVAKVSSVLIVLMPSAVNFSIFGLRDIILYAFVVSYAAAVYAMWYESTLTRRMQCLVFSIISLIGIASLRLELFSFILVPIFGYIFLGYRSFSKRVIPGRKKEAVFRYLFSTLFLALACITCGAVLYTVTLGQINKVGLSPSEVVEIASQARLERAEGGTGGDSNFAASESYANLPWWQRWGIQSIGLVIVPFPWQVNSVARLLAFSDTIVLIYFLYRLLRGKSRHIWTNLNTAEFWFMSTAICGVIVMGLIVINSGNAFRMRLPVLPFILILAGIEWSRNPAFTIKRRAKDQGSIRQLNLIGIHN